MNPEAGLRAGLWASVVSVLTSTSTLVCCALPALLVTLGAGAVLAGMVSAVPQLVWLSAHKIEVFGSAGFALVVAAAMQWWARSLPCPTEPRLAAACMRTRRASWLVYWTSLAIFAIGVLFAFIVPAVL